MLSSVYLVVRCPLCGSGDAWMVTTSRASFARRSGFLRPGARRGAAADPPGAVSAADVLRAKALRGPPTRR